MEKAQKANVDPRIRKTLSDLEESKLIWIQNFVGNLIADQEIQEKKGLVEDLIVIAYKAHNTTDVVESGYSPDEIELSRLAKYKGNGVLSKALMHIYNQAKGNYYIGRYVIDFITTNKVKERIPTLIDIYQKQGGCPGGLGCYAEQSLRELAKEYEEAREALQTVSCECKKRKHSNNYSGLAAIIA